ncbi:11074_t:CDS:2 [Acaulospora colombiana]|uniref:11074_t:CDS:1 n=1 Tax=Acaulospora colombiana TaxID=27376 RepID=A0ACA9JXG6_9GLOM|nr:11074_t:CDS:2 [Acaulospora colombiana]
MKWVEKVFEMHYPDWENRKQIPNSEAIKRVDLEYDSQGSPLAREQILKSYEKFLATAMSMLEFKDEDVPPTIRDETKADLYRWVDATGITIKNCNIRLKCILRAFYEILDNKENKASKDLDNMKPFPNPSANAYLNTFANFNKQKINESQQAQNLKGKSWNELNYEPKFFGNEQKGKITLEQIINSIIL